MMRESVCRVGGKLESWTQQQIYRLAENGQDRIIEVAAHLSFAT